MTQDRSLDELVRQIQQADEEERRQLLDRLAVEFAQAAYRWANVILNNEDKAYDAVQEAWLNAYLHLGQLRESAAFPGWFRQIVLHSCYRVLRSDKPAIPLSEQLPEEVTADPSETFEANELLEHIREAVLGLPDGERVVTELFYFDDYSQQEIAEMLAIPITTIKKRLQYARRRLKTVIQPETISQLDVYALHGGCTAAGIGVDMTMMTDWLPIGMTFASEVDLVRTEH